LDPGEYLWIEDTTGLDFSTRPSTEGLGQIGNQYGRGLKLHTTLAARVEHWTLDQTPELSLVGALAQECWARPQSKVKRGTERWRKRLSRPRESERWARVLQEMPTPPKEVSWTLIADREGDIYEVLESCREKQMDFVVRAHYRRCLVDSDESAFEVVAKAPVLGSFEVELRSRGGQAARRATVELRSAQVILKGAWRPEGTRLPLAVTVVEAREINPPAGVEPIAWVLFTSFTVGRFVEARRVVARYAQRWLIEEYHKVLKSGVHVEESQLQSAERLKPLTAVLVVIAVRLLNTKLLARTRPDQPVEPRSFGPEIMEILSARFGKPNNGWTYQSVLVAIAKMGGFLGRRHDGNPGWLTIWRGWQRLQTMADGISLSINSAASKQQSCG
jgi:hypothetical protein